jgi:hypothetical protein
MRSVRHPARRAAHLNFDALVVLRRVQEIELAKEATRKSFSRGIDGKNAATA